MLIQEVQGQIDAAKLSAVAQFLVGRAQDTGATKTFSVQAFLKLANAQGISLTAQQLKDQSQLPPLSNIIEKIEIDPANPAAGTIYFKGAEVGPGPETMSVDQARKTVDKMAKRAGKI